MVTIWQAIHDADPGLSAEAIRLYELWTGKRASGPTRRCIRISIYSGRSPAAAAARRLAYNLVRTIAWGAGTCRNGAVTGPILLGQ